MAILRVVTVKSSGGDYSSLNAALVGEMTNFVTLNRELRIDCYPFRDTTTANPSSFTLTTDATHTLTINAVADHGGAWNAAGYVLGSTAFGGGGIAGDGTDISVVGLQIEVPQAGQGIAIANAVRWTLDRVLVRSATRDASYGVYLWTGGSACVVRNCVAYGFHVAGTTGAAFLTTVASHAFLNCTAVDSDSGFSGPGRYVNCLAQSSTGSDFAISAANAASSNNVSADATAPGSNSRTSKTASFRSTVAGSEDYHLLSSDTAAKGFGTSLRDDATWPFTADLDGAERHGTWDVGADQYVAPTTWTLNDLAPLPLTETFATPATAFSQRADIFPLGILLEAAATAVNVTGVAATANAPETSTLSSREVVTGSATSATAAETGSATGLERMLGTAATATAPETSTLASTEVITGSLTSADAPETTNVAGREVFTGAASTATAPETSTLASAEVISGSATTAEAAGTSALTGAEAMAGALASATAPETSTLASTEVITGSIASADAAQPTSATGQEVFVGNAATATAPETSTLASVEVVTGSVASATAAESSALTGAEAFTGAIGSATAPETSTLASTEVISGSATSADAAQSGDLAGAEVFVGAIDSATAAETTTLASTEVVTGAIASADDAQTSHLTGEITPPVDDGSSTGEITSAQDAQSSELTGAVANPEVIPPAPIGGGGIVRPRVPKKRGPHITVVAPPAVRTWVVPRARVVLGGHTAQPAPARTGWVVPSATMALGASVPAVQPARSQWIALAPAVLIAPDPDEEFLILSLADGLL